MLRQPIELPQPARSPVSITASIGIATGLPASAEELCGRRRRGALQGQGGRQGRLRPVRVRDADRRAGSHPPRDGPGGCAGGRSSSSSSTSRCSTSRPSRSWAWRRCCAGAIPPRGVIAPDVFIPIAEDSGLIIAIGRWVLEQACARPRRGARTGYSSWHLGQRLRAAARARASSSRRCDRCWTDSGLDPAR